MATLDYTLGGPNAVSWREQGLDFAVARLLNVPSIIAADATMTTNGFITVADVIQAIDIPAHHLVNAACLEIVTAGTATATMDVGINGGQELGAAYALDAVAGTRTYHTCADANVDNWDAGDTVDAEYLVANSVIGKTVLYVFGIKLPYIVTS